MTVDYARCLPVLPSLNIRETQAFYVERLGFWSVVYEAIRSGQVPALFAEYTARGGKILDGFEVRPWNMKEFHVSDPHGNLLRFGCAPEEV